MEAHVLIVDDQPSVRSLFARRLASQGYHIDEASSGEEAVEMAKYKRYHLVLMDVVMPGMGGFEACKKIKSSGRSENAPVIFVSAEGSEKFEGQGVEVGSIDYLLKPVNLEDLTSKAAVHIKSSLLMQELEQYKDRMEHDIQRASDLYDAFLPTQEHIKEVEEKYHVEINSFFEPYNEIGGDFWKLVAIDESKFGVLYVDFSGHGVASALNVAYTRAVLSQPIKWHLPEAVIQFLNKNLSDVLPQGSFATVIYVVFDVKKQKSTYINSASPYPIIISANTNTVSYEEKSIVPLGIWESTELNLEGIVHVFEPGSEFIIYSDVLLENKHQDGKRWMTEGVIENVKSCIAEEKGNLLSCVHDKFIKTAIPPLMDDLTLISVRFKK